MRIASNNFSEEKLWTLSAQQDLIDADVTSSTHIIESLCKNLILI